MTKSASISSASITFLNFVSTIFIKIITFILNVQNHSQKSQQFMPAPQLDDFQFPRLSPQGATGPSVNVNRPQVTAAQSNRDLFTPTELMAIFKEMMFKMQSATSKLEQIHALSDIVMKYVGR
jgi:hypothetical protein